MKIQKLVVVISTSLLLGACATPPKDVASVDARIADVAKGDFGQFVYHQSLAGHNLDELRKAKQYWQDDHYWNIDLNQRIADATVNGAAHRKAAEDALIRWHDNCGRHQELCQRVSDLEDMHTRRLLPVAYFDTGSAVPKSIRQESINSLLQLTKEYPNLGIDLVAYTDTVGSAHSNKHLAARRADAVSKLLAEHGLSATSADVHEIAEGEAGGPDNTPNAENRRVDVRVHHHGAPPPHGDYQPHRHSHPHFVK